MIKLKTIITESSLNVKGVDEEVVKKLLGTDFTIAARLYKTGMILYRAHTRLDDKYTIAYPSKTERKSRDTSNMYTVLLSNLPSWRKYPKRSFSLMFTNDARVAKGYGWHAESEIVKVLPKNDANIAVCKTADAYFEESFPYLYKHTGATVEDFAGSLNNLVVKLTGLGLTFSDLKDSLYKSFIDELNNRLPPRIMTGSTLNRLVIGDDISFRFKDFYIKTLENHKGNWELFFDDLLNPNKNGFQLLKLSDIGSVFGEEREMWTDVDCILVK